MPRGLKGVVVADTEVGDVRGSEGFYHYRQYSAVELAERRPLEDVWHLMFDGELPDRRRARRVRGRGRAAAGDPAGGARPCCRPSPRSSEPLDGLRTALSLAAADRGLRPIIDIDAAQRRADALFLCAVTPTLLSALHRLRHGLEPIAPATRPRLRGQLPVHARPATCPTAEHARAVEQYLISTIDHGFNASTFTARVVASTGADLGACVVGASAR